MKSGVKGWCIACLVGVFGCEDSMVGPDANPEITVVEPEPPEVTVVDPLEAVDGEYDVRVRSTSYVCDGVVSHEPTISTIANVVERDDGTLDLLPRGAGAGFANYTFSGVKREAFGYFEKDEEFFLNLGNGDYTVIRNIVGSAFQHAIDFSFDWVVGWPEPSGSGFYTLCEIYYNAGGFRRFLDWQGSPRVSIDGQWRVHLDVLEDSLVGPGDGGKWVIDTIVQSDDNSVFDLEGTRFSFKRLPRDPTTGEVSVLVIGYLSYNLVKGVVLNHKLDLTKPPSSMMRMVRSCAPQKIVIMACLDLNRRC